jgi:ankyrin repeat protein
MRKSRLILIPLFLIFFALQGCRGLFAPSHHRTEDYTPVFAAASAGDLEAIKAAVKNDRSVLTAREWEDMTLLHDAVGQNHKDVAAFLLDQGADVNPLTKDRLTPLHMAAQNGNMEIVQLLLDRKADINAVDALGWTPVDRATKWRHPTVAAFLRLRGGQGVTSGAIRPASTGPTGP